MRTIIGNTDVRVSSGYREQIKRVQRSRPGSGSAEGLRDQGESYVRSHANASTAGSTRRQAKSLGRIRFAKTAVLAVAIAALLACAAGSASASLLRNHETSFGSFTGENPSALTVDQSNGDIYVIDTAGDKVLRFNSSGLPGPMPVPTR